jgi:vancomycin resistance protein YoaR
VYLRFQEKLLAPTWRELGLAPDVDKAVQQAYNLARFEGFWPDLTRVLRAKRGESTLLSLPVLLYNASAQTYLKNLADFAQRNPRDAAIVVQNGTVHIVPEQLGLRCDIPGTLAAIKNLAYDGRVPPTVEFAAQILQPKLTAAQLSSVNTLLAEYTTPIKLRLKNRTHNVKVACDHLNGTLILPGEEFSFNQTVGPRLASLGFKDAPTFEQGRIKDGIGGGVCQVSSTLFNVALMADLEIRQREAHSRPVNYCPPGRDATVAYGRVDLKFRNPFSNPVFLQAFTDGRSVTVRAFGNAADDRNVALVTRVLKSWGRPALIRMRANLPPGAVKVQDPGNFGQTVALYRVFRESQGGPEKTELIRVISYNSHAKIVEVGLAAPPKSAEPKPVASPETSPPRGS